MSRKYAVLDNGQLVSSNDIPNDWEVAELGKQAVANAIKDIEWETDPLLDLVISQDVMCVCEVVPLHTVSVDVQDKNAQLLFEQIEEAA